MPGCIKAPVMLLCVVNQPVHLVVLGWFQQQAPLDQVCVFQPLGQHLLKGNNQCVLCLSKVRVQAIAYLGKTTILTFTMANNSSGLSATAVWTGDLLPFDWSQSSLEEDCSSEQRISVHTVLSELVGCVQGGQEGGKWVGAAHGAEQHAVAERQSEVLWTSGCSAKPDIFLGNIYVSSVDRINFLSFLFTCMSF